MRLRICEEKRMSAPGTPEPATRRQELRVFLFLTVLLFPALAVAIVAGYGFLVWIWQIFTGPPGV
jgi:periplasmic nitrate reductase NapE